MKNFIKRVRGLLNRSTRMDFNDFLHECRSVYLGRMPHAEKILSVGCAGTWYFEWFNKFYRYPISEHIGIDLNPKPDDLPTNIAWIQHDASDLSPVSSRYVDMVFAGQFIEHISWERQVKFLIEVNRVLKRNGVFVLDSPNYPITNRYGWKQPEHVHELSFAQICDVLRLAGFEVSSSYGILPKGLIDTPPELEGKCLEAGMHTCMHRSDIRKAIDGNPQDSFIWWIAARKNTETFDRTKLQNRLKGYYETNESNQNRAVYHQIGRLFEKGGECLIEVSESDGYGFALYGPYKVYSEGNYIVEFAISLSNPERCSNPDVGVCIIDVATEGGRTILAKKEVKANDLSDTRGANLEFTLNAPASLEFRVLSLGALPFSVDTIANALKL